MSILATRLPRWALLTLAALAAAAALLATSAAPASAQARYECFSNGNGGYECIWIPSDLDPGGIRDLDIGT
jgi:ABC-type sugar transport system substrate-binding protein